jgi:hypothetical protein
MVRLGYGTTEKYLSMEECEDFQKPTVNAILPKMVIYRETAGDVVFRITKYGWLGLAHLAPLQGYGQLQYPMGHLRSEYTPRTLYQILVEFRQLECDMEEEILSCDKNMLTPNWIMECRRFLKQCDATILTTGTRKPLRGRTGNVTLMEVFSNKNFTAK